MVSMTSIAFKGLQSLNNANAKLNNSERMCQPLTHNNSQPLSGNVKVYGNAGHLGNNLNRIV